MAFGDFLNRMTSTDRLKESFRNPGPLQGIRRTGEDLDTLFMGAEPEPYTPPVAEPTLKAADSRATSDEQTKKRRPASNMAKDPLSTKTVLGG